MCVCVCVCVCVKSIQLKESERGTGEEVSQRRSSRKSVGGSPHPQPF